MAKSGSETKYRDEVAATTNDDIRSLLSEDSLSGDDFIEAKTNGSRRQSLLAQLRPNGAPRTVNRVRFEVDNNEAVGRQSSERISDWVDEEDYWTQDTSDSLDARGLTNQRLPLLSHIEAPSVTLASQDSSHSSHLQLEDAGQKSGMRNAFMNMANSIM